MQIPWPTGDAATLIVITAVAIALSWLALMFGEFLADVIRHIVGLASDVFG